MVFEYYSQSPRTLATALGLLLCELTRIKSDWWRTVRYTKEQEIEELDYKVNDVRGENFRGFLRGISVPKIILSENESVGFPGAFNARTPRIANPRKVILPQEVKDREVSHLADCEIHYSTRKGVVGVDYIGAFAVYIVPKGYNTVDEPVTADAIVRLPLCFTTF
jgi:hypothetical protein